MGDGKWEMGNGRWTMGGPSSRLLTTEERMAGEEGVGGYCGFAGFAGLIGQQPAASSQQPAASSPQPAARRTGDSRTGRLADWQTGRPAAGADW
jgi:hypothetical protein